MLFPAAGGPRTRHNEATGSPPSIIWSTSGTPIGRRFIESTCSCSPLLRGLEDLFAREDLDPVLGDAIGMRLCVVGDAAHLFDAEDPREGRPGEDLGQDDDPLREELLEDMRALELSLTQ